MAVVPITISGVAYPKDKKNPPMPVTIVGNAWISGLSVSVEPPQLPPGTPEHPIVYPPEVWPPEGHPEHPIALPPEPPPVDPPRPGHELPPASGSGRWVWSDEYGWFYIFVPGDKGPKR